LLINSGFAAEKLSKKRSHPQHARLPNIDGDHLELA
jgi:hypothetical protein